MNAKNAVKKRLGTQGTALLQRDIYRFFRTPLLYLFMLCAAVIPGSMSVMTGFEPGYDAWGQVSGLFSAGIFAIAGVFLAFFIGNDYKSGAVKNICRASSRMCSLFTQRNSTMLSRKYIIIKQRSIYYLILSIRKIEVILLIGSEFHKTVSSRGEICTHLRCKSRKHHK